MQDRLPISSDAFIPSVHWCGRCLYNIPPGTLLLLLPAATMLLVGLGCALYDVLEHRENWQEGQFHVGLIFLSMGAILSIVVCFFCVRAWWDNRKYIPNRKRTDEEHIVQVEIGQEYEEIYVYEKTDDIHTHENVNTKKEMTSL